MAQSGSFIPNQKTRRPATVRRRRIYVVSFIVYTFFFGVLLTVAGLLVWEWQLNGRLASQQSALDEQRNTFSQSDIIRVYETEQQLLMVERLLDMQPAVSKIFTSLEETTVGTVQLTGLSVSTEGVEDNHLQVTYNGITDSFDSVLAQREVMEANALLSTAEVVDVVYGASERSDEQNESASFVASNPVSYRVALTLPIADVRFDGRNTALSDTSTEVTPAEAATSTGVGFVEDTEVESEVATSSIDTATTSEETN